MGIEARGLIRPIQTDHKVRTNKQTQLENHTWASEAKPVPVALAGRSRRFIKVSAGSGRPGGTGTCVCSIAERSLTAKHGECFKHQAFAVEPTKASKGTIRIEQPHDQCVNSVQHALPEILCAIWDVRSRPLPH